MSDVVLPVLPAEEEPCRDRRPRTRPALHRLQMVTGPAAIERLADVRVALFGLGGVGGWCAEALIRSGVNRLTLVDSDVVCITNVNRQIQAMPGTVGLPKVVVLKERLLQINPDAKIEARQEIYDATTADRFDLGSFDYVLDAIDSLSNKVDLIARASQAGATVYSALGASNRLDPTRIRVASLWDSEGCRLGRLVRKRLRQRGFSGDVLCVFSDESRVPLASDTSCGTSACLCPRQTAHEGIAPHEWCTSKAQINGSAVHVTGTFGFVLAGLVVQDVLQNAGAAAQHQSDLGGARPNSGATEAVS